MIAGMTVFTAQALVELVGEDDVLVVSTELTDEALSLTEHAVCDVCGAEAQQVSQLWSQAAAANGIQVTEREELHVFSKMTREERVKLFQNIFSQTTRFQEVLHQV